MLCSHPLFLICSVSRLPRLKVGHLLLNLAPRAPKAVESSSALLSSSGTAVPRVGGVGEQRTSSLPRTLSYRACQHRIRRPDGGCVICVAPSPALRGRMSSALSLNSAVDSTVADYGQSIKTLTQFTGLGCGRPCSCCVCALSCEPSAVSRVP